MEQNRNKDPSPGSAQLPSVEPTKPRAPEVAPELAQPNAASAAAAANGKIGEPGVEFSITLDKSDGMKLGIDVDHQDGVTLLIEAVSGGLMEAWNNNHPDSRVRQGDRIVEVNALRNDVLALVDECKKNQPLKMKIRRGGP